MGNKQDDAYPSALVAGLPQILFACNGSGEWSWASGQWSSYTGLSAAVSLGLGWLEAVHPDDRPTTMQSWLPVAASSAPRVIDHRIRRAGDGAYRWHRTIAACRAGSAGGESVWFGGSADMDDLHRRLQQAAEAERHLRVFVEGVPQLLWRSSDLGEWFWASPQWLDFTGQTQEQSQGLGWLDAVHPDDRVAALRAWEMARPHDFFDVNFRVLRHADGIYLWHRTLSRPIHDSSGRIVEWLGSTTDVQDLQALQERQQAMLVEAQHHARTLEDEVKERQRAEAQLLFDAHHDGLTGLRSRAFLMARLTEALDPEGRDRGCGCAILLLDLDRFKLVNNSLGHDAGNQLLIEVANRLRDCVRDLDATLARLGGDEFAILLRGVEDADAALAVARQVIASIGRPVLLAQQDVFSSCSLGLVHAVDADPAPEEMLRNADIALYRAKHDGGCVVFTEALRSEVLETFALRTDLRQALAHDEFRVHYQPICEAATRRIVGLEALVRWRHPRRGLVPPDGFIRIAEEMGLIGELGAWVLDRACRQMRIWREQFPGLDLYLNVNSSGEELKHADFTAGVTETLNRNGLDPHLLQLEVTENIFLRQPDRIGEILDRVRATGVRVALDDFGTGYSSLSYLDRYRVDTIKIDRSFVSGLQARPSASAIVQTIVRLGHAMALAVVAEGVEDDSQLQELRAMGCGIVQGYFLGRPAPADDITATLARQHRATSSIGP